MPPRCSSRLRQGSPSRVLVLGGAWLLSSACEDARPSGSPRETSSFPTRTTSETSSDGAVSTSGVSSDSPPAAPDTKDEPATASESIRDVPTNTAAESEIASDGGAQATSTSSLTQSDSEAEPLADAQVATGSPEDAGSDASDADAAASEPSFGHPVYTREEIDAWSTDNPEYNRLANSWAGNLGLAHTSYGVEISSGERDLLKDQSGYMKVQAVLWAADGNEARRTKVAAMLDELRPVTSWQPDSGEQYRLVAGWSCTNLAQAAAIIGYEDPQFTSFLVNECYPILDWSSGPNWHASFADSKLAIAAYVADRQLWDDAVEYFNLRIGQSIYHSQYDGSKIRPLLDENGAPQVGLTTVHWGGGVNAPQVNEDFTPVDPTQFPDGVNAERMRDLGHVSMGLGAFMHGARTIVAQGQSLEDHAYARLREAYTHHGDRVLAYLATGVIPDPKTMEGDGGGSLRQAWFGARKLFGDDSPEVVVTLCARPEVTGSAPVGANHLVAEVFADAW